MLQLVGALRRVTARLPASIASTCRLATSEVQRPGGEQEPETPVAAVPTSQYGEIGLISGAPGEVYTRKVHLLPSSGLCGLGVVMVQFQVAQPCSAHSLGKWPGEIVGAVKQLQSRPASS